MAYSSYKLPGQKYWPGLNKRPDGHMQGDAIPASDLVLDENNWPHHSEYLYGIDLLNAEYYWETHEILERVWNAAGRRSAIAQAVQSIIFLAAGQLKDKLKQRESALRLYQSAMKTMPKENAVYLGIDVAKYIRNIEDVNLNSDANLATLDLVGWNPPC